MLKALNILLNKYSLLPLVLIIFLAFFVRTFELGSVAPALNWDEVSHGYNAYSILKTGSDEWGQFMPLANFRAYGDYPLPLYMYLTMPFIKVFGLNEFSIRFTSALFGSLLILVTYLLINQLFKNKNLALIGSFLLALSPWGIMTSRQVLQATPAIFLLSLGVYLYLKYIESKKAIFAPLSFVLLGLSAYAYHNTRILAPVLAALLVLFFWKEFFKFKKIAFISLFIGFIFFAPLVPILLSPEGRARSSWVGIIDQGAINSINESRGNASLPEPIERVMYNKVTYSAKVAISNYFGYFGPLFLGFEGGTQYQYSIPHFGLIYPVELPFFYAGLIGLIWHFRKNDKSLKFLIVWLLLSPLPAAVTRDPYQVVRGTTMLPVIYLITAYGFSVIFNILKIRRKLDYSLLIGSFVFIVVTLFSFYFYTYLKIYPQQYSFAWQYGYKQSFEYMAKVEDNYDQIYITKKYGEPHEFLLFYLKKDPATYKSDPNLVRYPANNWFWNDGFSKYKFVNDEELPQIMSEEGKRKLIIASPGNYPSGAKVVETINFLDGSKAFEIVEL